MRTLLAILLFCTLQAASNAQSLPRRSNEPVYVMKGDGLYGGLTLDTLQHQKLLAVEQEYERAMDDLEQNDTISDVMAVEYAKHYSAYRQQRIRGVLTREQYKEWSRLVASPADTTVR